MAVAITVLSTKGQIVIPKQIREALHLQAGMRFSVEIEEDRIVLRPLKGSVAERLYGRLRGVNLVQALEEEHRWEREQEHERGGKGQAKDKRAS